MPGGRGIQYIGLKHGIEANAAQYDAMIGQHTGVVLQVLPHLGLQVILQ